MTSIAKRLIVSTLLVVSIATVASAYTLVLRDGRRLDIPDEFMVDSSTLTYELSNGVQITMQLVAIDVAATERLNGERSGALLRRAASLVPVSTATSKRSAVRTSPAAPRSITNRDLESYKRARVAADLSYDRQRKELGLPTLQETRKELTEMGDRTLEQLIKYRQQQDLETLRNQVSTMSTELMNVNAELDAVRNSQSYSAPYASPFGSPVYSSPYPSPFGYPVAYPVDGYGTNLPYGVVDPSYGRYGVGGRRSNRRVFVSPLGNPNPGFRRHPGFPGNRGGRRIGAPVVGGRGVRR